MSTRNLAQGLAGLGRYGDSVLVHMQPSEVAGLQSLARSNGTTLTINPDTGMPEAFNLGRALKGVAKAALPIAAGFALGPGGFGLFNSALTAGLAVGAGAYALTGDPMYGLSAGVGGAGGFGLGENLSAYGSAIKEVPKMGATPVASTYGASSLTEPSTAMKMFTSTADDAAAAAAPSAAKSLATQGGFDNAIAGAKGVFGSKPAGMPSYSEFLKQGYKNAAGDFVKPSMWQDVATVGMPVLSAMSSQPTGPLNLAPTPKSNYNGPYGPQDRGFIMPTEEETARMREEGSPEFLYFQNSNPTPGYRRLAAGGSIQSGGIRDLYGKPDDQLNGATLSQDGYGLGRLQQLYGSGGEAQGYAAGGEIPQIPSMGPASYMQQVAPITGAGDVDSNAYMQQVAPVTGAEMIGGFSGFAQSPNSWGSQELRQKLVGDMPAEDKQDIGGINTLLSQAVRDPLGRGMAKGGYLDGAGDGMSDSIPATIEGKQPARLADGEFVIPADVVSHLGNGSTKAGAKVLYKMMSKVRKARTGNSKQGRQINPSRFVPA